MQWVLSVCDGASVRAVDEPRAGSDPCSCNWQRAAGSGHRECRVSILAARGNTRANIHGRRRRDGCEDESRQVIWRDTAPGALFFLCHGAHVRSGWVSMSLPLLRPALPCPALPWQTLALPCSCTALARDTDTPLRYASLAIRQCQLWRAGCLPSELDHFARACVSLPSRH
jgi:hypothetical protein